MLLLSGTAAASAHSPVVVVLGIQEEGRPVATARVAVTQHLLRMGESVLAPAMSAQELLCTGSDCLQRVAKAFRADRLLGGEILPNDRNYIVRMWMLDVAQQQPSTTEEHCVECQREQVYEMLARSAGKLLDAAPVPPLPEPPLGAGVPAERPSPPPPPPPPVSEPTAVAPPPIAPRPAPEPPVLAAAPIGPRCAPRFYTFGRGVAAGALGGLGALGLVTAVGLTAADGTVYLPQSEGYPADITWNFQSQYRAAYVLTALTALGLGAILYDWSKLAGRSSAPAKTALCESPRSKWTFNRGLAVGALGSLLAGTLAVSAGLTALDGGSYVSDDPTRINTPIPYHFRTAYSVGYAASAGFLLGLGLAIFIP